MTAPLTTRTEIMSILENRGYRATAPRRVIIELLEGKKEGFTAEEISNELPGVGRATVFRTVKLLLNAGVLCRLNMMDGAPRYSISSVEHHHHTICVEVRQRGRVPGHQYRKPDAGPQRADPRRNCRPPLRVLRQLRDLPCQLAALWKPRSSSPIGSNRRSQLPVAQSDRDTLCKLLIPSFNLGIIFQSEQLIHRRIWLKWTIQGMECNRWHPNQG